MRTSRISPFVNSTYRKQYLHTNNGQIFQVMKDGGGHSFNRNHQDQNNRKKNAPQTQSALSRAVLSRHAKRMMLIGQPFDGESIENMRRRLLEHQMNIQKARNKEVLIRTYRSSI